MSTQSIIITLVVIVGVFVIYTFNSMVGLRNKVKEAFSTMDVYLKKRYDLIPNLVDIVKGYVKHESETLENLTKIRAGVADNSIAQKVEGEMKIGEALGKLIVIAENYPDLKANENFLDLQERLTKIEEEIAFARRYYNGSVREYNDKCQTFPNNIIANLFKFTSMPMYEVENENERKAVDVNL